MNITTIKITDQYRKLLQEDAGVAIPAPDGAMSAGPLQSQFFTDPKLSIYYPATGKRKYFKRQLAAEQYLKENPDWKPVTECDDTEDIKEIVEKHTKKKKYIWGYVPGLNDVDYNNSDINSDSADVGDSAGDSGSGD